MSKKTIPGTVPGTSKQETPGYNGAMDADTEKTAKPRRRRFRFSLRTLLIVVAVLSVPLYWIGWELREVRRERAAIAWVEKVGGHVAFFGVNDRFSGVERSWWEQTKGKWFGEKVGGVSIWESHLSPMAELKDLHPLAEFKELQWIHLARVQVSDLSHLAEMKNLEVLIFIKTQVSDLSPLAGVKNLKEVVLNRTKVSDLPPLAELKNLKRLELVFVKVSDKDKQVQELRLALPNCEIETE